jgi:hypothetical protein
MDIYINGGNIIKANNIKFKLGKDLIYNENNKILKTIDCSNVNEFFYKLKLIINNNVN